MKCLYIIFSYTKCVYNIYIFHTCTMKCVYYVMLDLFFPFIFSKPAYTHRWGRGSMSICWETWSGDETDCSWASLTSTAARPSLTRRSPGDSLLQLAPGASNFQTGSVSRSRSSLNIPGNLESSFSFPNPDWQETGSWLEKEKLDSIYHGIWSWVSFEILALVFQRCWRWSGYRTSGACSAGICPVTCPQVSH